MVENNLHEIFSSFFSTNIPNTQYVGINLVLAICVLEPSIDVLFMIKYL